MTHSEYRVRLFADNSIKGRCNKALIAKVCRVLSKVRLHHNLSIEWTKAHNGLLSPESVGNAAANRLAARGRTGSTSTAVLGPVLPPRVRAPRPAPAYMSKTRHGSRRRRRSSGRDPWSRAPDAYEFLSCAQRTGSFTVAW